MLSIKETYEAIKVRRGAFVANLAVLGALAVGMVVFSLVWSSFFPTSKDNNFAFYPTYEMGGSLPTVAISRDSYSYDNKAVMNESYAGTPQYLIDKPLAPSYAPYPPEVINFSNNIISVDRRVIKNGSLDIRVNDAEETVDGIEMVASGYDGFVDSTNIYEISEGVKAGNITIRVPNDKFLTAMDDIKKLAIKVQSENVSSSDVTAQAVDLEAQIKNLRVEEEQYRGLMSRSGKIEDILNVANRLSEVRGRIEQIQAQINHLSRQVAMSTISISLTAEPEVKIFGIVWKPLTTIKQALRAMVADLAGFVDSAIFFLAKLPVLILRIVAIGLVLFALWKIVLFIKRKFTTNI